jgi:hypothetical protein
MYPVNTTCPPVDYAKGEKPGSCTLGPNPRYAVNATSAEHVQHTIAFAKEHNIRLVTKSTGHDINGRSDGFGSLELWLRYHRNGITFQPTYEATNGCQESSWKGSAIKISGAYQWQDVYVVAKEHDVIVVGVHQSARLADGQPEEAMVQRLEITAWVPTKFSKSKQCWRMELLLSLTRARILIFTKHFVAVAQVMQWR